MTEPAARVTRAVGSSESPLVPVWLAGSAAVGWRVLAMAGLAIVVGIVASSISVSVTAVLVSLVLAARSPPRRCACVPAGRRGRSRRPSRSPAARS